MRIGITAQIAKQIGMITAQKKIHRKHDPANQRRCSEKNKDRFQKSMTAKRYVAHEKSNGKTNNTVHYVVSVDKYLCYTVYTANQSGSHDAKYFCPSSQHDPGRI